MSENSPFPTNQLIQPPINARPNTDYSHGFFPPQSTTSSTQEGFERPPQRKPRFSNPIQDLSQNFLPNPMTHPPNTMTRNLPPIYPPQNAKGMFFKTRLCTQFNQGYCASGNNCSYAHGHEELRKPPPSWKEHVVRNEQHTKLCRHVYKSCCPYGDACTFRHSDPISDTGDVGLMQLRDLEANMKHKWGNSNMNFNAIRNQKMLSYKTKRCHAYDRDGICRNGDQCQFAHGDADLRRSFGGYKKLDTRPNIEAASLTNPCPTPAYDASPINTQPPACVQQTEDEDDHSYVWRGPTKLSLIYGDWIYDPS